MDRCGNTHAHVEADMHTVALYVPSYPLTHT